MYFNCANLSKKQNNASVKHLGNIVHAWWQSSTIHFLQHKNWSISFFCVQLWSTALSALKYIKISFHICCANSSYHYWPPFETSDFAFRKDVITFLSHWLFSAERGLWAPVTQTRSWKMKTTDAITQMLVKACFMISLANTERTLPPQKKIYM